MTHYYSEKQNSEVSLKKIHIGVKGLSFDIFTAQGVFSKDKLDKGTKTLIENCVIEKDWSVLDMGSGYGVVGISIKKLFPSVKVVMADINERAVMLCKKNIKLHKLKEVRAIKSDIYSEIEGDFNTVLVNPPQTAGKEICFSIIEGAKKHLFERGLLQLVARHRKGGVSLEKKMKEVFGNVDTIAKSGGYRVYVSKR